MIRWQTGKEIHLDIEHSKNYEHTVALVKTCFVSESDLRAVIDKLEITTDDKSLVTENMNIGYSFALNLIRRELWGDKVED